MQWLMSVASNLGEWEAGWWPPRPPCFWHVSAEWRCASLCSEPPPPLSVWPWPPVRLLTSLTQQPSFPFQSQTHECRKLITPHQGEVDAEESLGETERERWRGEWGTECRAGVFFTSFVPPKVPFLLFPSLSPRFANEWHYRQCYIQSDTNLFR